MEIKELITFLSLAKTLNYQESAAQLQYAPSTLKKHISNLEVELRVPLFKKEGRHIQITPEGERFFDYAHNLVADYRKAVDSLSAKKQELPPITVAGCEANLISEMDEVFEDYASQYPDTFILKSMSSNSAAPSLVKSGAADIGFHYTLDAQPIAGLESFFLYREQLDWMAHTDHPLLEKKHIRFADLDGQCIVTQHLDCCFINDALRRVRQSGADSVGLVSLFFSNLHTVDQEMLKTKCVRLRPHATLPSPTSANLEFLDMAEEPCWVYNRIIVRPEAMQDERVRQLIQVFRKHAEQLIAGDPSFFASAPR